MNQTCKNCAKYISTHPDGYKGGMCADDHERLSCFPSDSCGEWEAKESTNDIDHTFTSEIVCPHCGYEFCDSWDYIWSGNEIEIDCPGCGEEFSAERNVEITYSTKKK